MAHFGRPARAWTGVSGDPVRGVGVPSCCWCCVAVGTEQQANQHPPIWGWMRVLYFILLPDHHSLLFLFIAHCRLRSINPRRKWMKATGRAALILISGHARLSEDRLAAKGLRRPKFITWLDWRPVLPAARGRARPTASEGKWSSGSIGQQSAATPPYARKGCAP